MKLRYHELARKEVLDIKTYYRDIRPELAVEFLAELDAAIRQIKAEPLRFEQVRKGIRRCSLERLPYGIYYRIPDPKTVRIIVIRHHSRQPGYGMRRK
jgi:plasmid stabilization system protein ParE